MSFEETLLLIMLTYLFGTALSIALMTLSVRIIDREKEQYFYLYSSLVPFLQYLVILRLSYLLMKKAKLERDSRDSIS